MYTITLPNSDGKSISSFHIYCVAIGSVRLHHTCAIDFYANKVEELMKGKQYYCALRREVINAKFRVLAALSDCPEKSFHLKTMLLGTYGRIAS